MVARDIATDERWCFADREIAPDEDRAKLADAHIETDLNLALGTALIATRGLIYPVKSAFDRARELSTQRGRNTERFVATWGLWHFNNVRSSFSAATEFAEELLELAHDQDRARA